MYSWVCMMHRETLWVFQSCHRHYPKAVFFLSGSFPTARTEGLEPGLYIQLVSCQVLPFKHFSVDCLALLMTLTLSPQLRFPNSPSSLEMPQSPILYIICLISVSSPDR